jgi:hypothetical protein
MRATTFEVVPRSTRHVAGSKALIRKVTFLIGNDLVILEIDIADCRASVDGQSTSILSSFFCA